jgi:AraC-like DNA-binding protein
VNSCVEPGCEFIRFASDEVLLGEFRCAPDFTDFRGAGRIRNYVIAFPRTSVWIHREGEQPFVSDPTTAVLHAPGRAYERAAISAEGDETDWIAVAEPLVREVVSRHSPRDAEADAAFAHGRAAIAGRLYRAQRELFGRAREPGVDPLEIEERSIDIVATVLDAAYASGPPRSTTSTRGRSHHLARRDLVEEAKALLAATLFENLTVREIAARIGVSPFHLCRTFRASTGHTLHAHRRELRLRLALGLVPRRLGALSALALDLGFHSHAHLTSLFRKTFGVPPTSVRTS